jgi:hypothetical protein
MATTVGPVTSSQRRKTWLRSIFFVGVLVLLVATFVVLGVSRVMELGSAAFFFVVTAGVLVLLCFFCGLIAYARAKLLSVQANQETQQAGDTPVFYFLETIHRTVPLEPVADDDYWYKDGCENHEVLIEDERKGDNEQCPICLCEMDPLQTATGLSACCRREIHIKCAQDYFNSIRRVKCVFCRKDVEETANTSLITTCPSPPLQEQLINDSTV